MKTKALLLFDIDGTLLLTGGCGKVALEKAFEEMFRIPDCWAIPCLTAKPTRRSLTRSAKNFWTGG